MKGRAGLGVALWCLTLGAAQAQDKQVISLEFQDAPVWSSCRRWRIIGR